MIHAEPAIWWSRQMVKKNCYKPKEIWIHFMSNLTHLKECRQKLDMLTEQMTKIMLLQLLQGKWRGWHDKVKGDSHDRNYAAA